MKLIPEKEVYENGLTIAGNQRTGFRKGVEFAETQLLPIFQEYVDWYKKHVRNADLPNHFCLKGQWTMCYKKEHIFEQFLKSRL